jgi:anti-anti-sigma factor
VDAAVVVRLAGELDLATAAEFRLRLLTVVTSGAADTIVLDLSRLRFIDGHSVGLILNARAAAQACDRQLWVDGLHGIPALVFGVLGLEPILTRKA